MSPANIIIRPSANKSIIVSRLAGTSSRPIQTFNSSGESACTLSNLFQATITEGAW